MFNIYFLPCVCVWDVVIVTLAHLHILGKFVHGILTPKTNTLAKPDGDAENDVPGFVFILFFMRYHPKLGVGIPYLRHWDQTPMSPTSPVLILDPIATPQWPISSFPIGGTGLTCLLNDHITIINNRPCFQATPVELWWHYSVGWADGLVPLRKALLRTVRPPMAPWLRDGGPDRPRTPETLAAWRWRANRARKASSLILVSQPLPVDMTCSS